MIHPLERKMVLVTPPAAIVDNAAVTTAIVDTVGFDYAVFTVIMGATDIALTVLKLQEGDQSNMADAADIVGTRFGTDNNDTGAASTLPAATHDNSLQQICVDLRGRKRYLDINVTIGDGTVGGFVTVICELWRGEQSPRTAIAANGANAQRMIV